jgi:hypothetical protein
MVNLGFGGWRVSGVHVVSVEGYTTGTELYFGMLTDTYTWNRAVNNRRLECR